MATEEYIKKTLRMLGVKTSNCGYSYIAHGVVLTLGDESYLEHITKGLYVDIARQFRTSPGCVERDIRTAVESIWRTEDRELLAKICGGTPGMRRPPNGKFFEMMHGYFSNAPCMDWDAVPGTQHPDYWCGKVDGECARIKAMFEEMGKLKEMLGIRG